MEHLGISSITLRNFKGVGPQGVEVSIRPITLLFGTNSAGKSTIFQSLHYLREVLERRNANPDATLIGGSKQDLGGFGSLVHNHDTSKSITVGVEIHPRDDDAYWDYLPIYLLNDDQQDLVTIGELSRLFDIDRIGVEVTTAWNVVGNTATIVGYRVSINGEPVASLMRSDPEKPELQGPGFKARWSIEPKALRFLARRWEGRTEEVMTDEDLPNIEPLSDVPEDWTETCLPTWGQPVALPQLNPTERDGINFSELLRMVLSQMLEGIGRRVLGELQQIRYIGPWRAVPDRLHRVPRIPDEARWSDGLGAWDVLARVSEAGDPGQIIPAVNDWLQSENRFATDYFIESRAEILLDANGPIVQALQRFMVAYDDLSADDFAIMVWQPLLAQNRQQHLSIYSRSTGLPLAPADIGVGISQVLPLIVAAHIADRKTIAIEQPELHIHPAMQVVLADLVIDASRQRSLTMLIETHSEHLVLRLLRRIRESTRGELKDPKLMLTPDDISILYIAADVDGLKVTKLLVDAEGEFLVRWPNKKGFFGERLDEVG